ncbi:MAG: mechanosensitive ion channel family protein [Bacillota bacterium]
MNLFEDVKSLLSYSFFNVSLGQITIAVIIVLISLGLRQLFVKVISKLVKKITEKTKSELDDQLIWAFDKPIGFVFVVIGIYIASEVLGLPDDAERFTNHVVRSLIAFSVFWSLYRASNALSGFLSRLAQKTETRLDDVMLPFLRNGLKVIIVVLGTIVIVQEWEYDVAGLLAGLGLGGLAFALAAKDTAANLFGSIMIMIDRPFMMGDWIMTPHVEGTVEEIGFRSTRVRTFSQALVTIPNALMSNDPITNWSRMGKRRISFRLGVTYDTPADRIHECLKRMRGMLENHSGVHPHTIFVYFERFGDSALEIFLYFFTKTTNWQEFLEIQEDINLKIMAILEELDISIAFPSRSIYIESVESKKEVEFKN